MSDTQTAEAVETRSGVKTGTSIGLRSSGKRRKKRKDQRHACFSPLQCRYDPVKCRKLVELYAPEVVEASDSSETSELAEATAVA